MTLSALIYTMPQCDGETDGQTELVVQYRAASMLTRDRNRELKDLTNSKRTRRSLVKAHTSNKGRAVPNTAGGPTMRSLNSECSPDLSRQLTSYSLSRKLSVHKFYQRKRNS